jgi:hypothetical protein
MHADLKKGIPSIICMRYDARPKTTEHFRLILGYDARTDEVIFHEPAVEKGAYKRMKRNMLIRLWPLKYDARKWTVIRMALKPKKLNEIAAARGRYTPADYAAGRDPQLIRAIELADAAVASRGPIPPELGPSPDLGGFPSGTPRGGIPK